MGVILSINRIALVNFESVLNGTLFFVPYVTQMRGENLTRRVLPLFGRDCGRAWPAVQLAVNRSPAYRHPIRWTIANYPLRQSILNPAVPLFLHLA